MGDGWEKKGNALFVGNTYVGDNIGGFLGTGARNLRPQDQLMGGYFSKG